MKEFIHDFLHELEDKQIDRTSLDKLKVRIAKKHNLKKIPGYNEILLTLSQEDNKKLSWIVNKPARTVSGVAPISIMSKPSNCPSQAKCTFCPGGINSPFGNTPKSYTGNEPASRRALRNNYDSYLQVMNRIEQYIVNNHVPEKIELILQGSTFPSFSRKYQDDFIGYAIKAMNDFSSIFFTPEFNLERFREFFMLPANIKDKERVLAINNKLLELKGKCDLELEKKRNETARLRCIGLTIETRPDYGMLEHAKIMLAQAATRVELGIQSVYDDVLLEVKRGHDVQATIDSIAIMKDLGFKINGHYMLGLPNSSYERDLAGLNELFINPDFRPDMLKIYPCLVMPGTPLYDTWKSGNYTPLETKDAASIIAEFKKDVPEYCRIMRIQRDIPTNITAAGVDRTNLRQYVMEETKKLGIKCRCIRCREAGRNANVDVTSLVIKEYDASKGKEFFISIEDVKNDILLGFCRLRFPARQLLQEITKTTAIIRELHVYGQMAALGMPGTVQHKGIGSLLLKTAEKIAFDNGKDKMLVISGIGVREYYKHHGYSLESYYMSKMLG